ncbi:unnamed protein product, partial [marine sediment metagenome]
MCGIGGIYNFNHRPVQRSQLEKMNNKMIHRGPDDEGYFCDGNIGIGIRRLAIIDIEGGHQPVSNEDASVKLVMNGEIYNYVEIRKELISRGHVFSTNSDAEVLVHLYEEEGKMSVHKLNGMFAFILWDKNKNLLW